MFRIQIYGPEKNRPYDPTYFPIDSEAAYIQAIQEGLIEALSMKVETAEEVKALYDACSLGSIFFLSYYGEKKTVLSMTVVGLGEISHTEASDENLSEASLKTKYKLASLLAAAPARPLREDERSFIEMVDAL